VGLYYSLVQPILVRNAKKRYERRQ
jgi:hypothetical protein